MLDFSTKLVYDVYLRNRSTRLNLFKLISAKFNFRQDMMSEISKAFVKKYNGVWTCLAGPNLVYGTYPRPQNFIQFDIKEDFGCFCRIIIFQNGQEVQKLRFSVEFKFHEQDMMSEISKAFVKKYNGVWTCLAGPKIVYGKYPRPQNFIQFDIKEDFGCFCRIIIFQNGQEVQKL
ncbi:unnamed protein product, partial [Mesorhabditis belari]|uniref:Uncharacterized protein n=1 Tax=Mesorhabditis belari TaxID=2138241 RepID=A0AAF3FI12_9BILA